MAFKNKIKSYVRSDWLVSFLLFLVFLAVRGYKFGWDDQHLEIPHLKSLIDPTLYPGDYYVQSLKSNFVSYLYPLLSHLITIQQIPATYFVLYLTSRYFLLFWLYKLWLLISKERFSAFIAVIVFVFYGRVEGFLYRTFSHQELSLAIVAAGLYLFYKERFILAGAVLGLSANFHALYSFLPMTYLGFYLLFYWRRHGWTTFLKSIGAYLILASPIIVWVAKNHSILRAAPNDFSWIPVYKTVCPANFIFQGITFKYIFLNFKVWFLIMQKYLLLASLYFLNLFHNPKFRDNKKNHVMALVVVAFLIISYVFTYIKPTKFILDLNFVRHTQFLYLFLMGYTALFAMQWIDKEDLRVGFCAALLLSFLALNDLIALAASIFMTVFLFMRKLYQKKERSPLKTALGVLSLIILAACILLIIGQVLKLRLVVRFIITAFLTILLGLYFFIHLRPAIKHSLWMKRLAIALPLATMFIYLGYYHFTRVNLESKGPGFWKLQRDWEDMQKYVRTHTPKEAKLLVPHDMEMGGFRTFSERTIVCCYRDCGVIGFSYAAVTEWIKRLHDIESFKVKKDSDIKPAIMNAVNKYKVDYIVFMRYYAPHFKNRHLFQKIYENDNFSLFKVRPNPAAQPSDLL